MKVGDTVRMTKAAVKECRTQFTTGVVTVVDGNMIRVKRDQYRGHESTLWWKDDWKTIKI